MSNKVLSEGAPQIGSPLQRVDDEVAQAFLALFRVIETLRNDIVEVVNFNSIEVFDQNGIPTVESGRIALWKDADASSSNPTHYIVANVAGTTVTFASEEVVP
jgi:hypothetical protein